MAGMLACCAGDGVLVVICWTVMWENPESNFTMVSCVCHDRLQCTALCCIPLLQYLAQLGLLSSTIIIIQRQCLWCCHRDHGHCESSPGWWMQTERRVAASPQTKPSDLSCESADKWLLPSTSTIAICYYYSARKLILILPSHGGWKAESTWAQQEGCAAHAQGCTAQWLSW